MGTSVTSTGITFPDATVQTTAATGGSGLPTTYTGVGSTVSVFYSGNTVINANATVSGAYLFYSSAGSNVQSISYSGGSVPGNRVNATATFTGSGQTWVSLGTGTWLNVGVNKVTAAIYDSCSNQTFMPGGIFRRIS